MSDTSTTTETEIVETGTTTEAEAAETDTAPADISDDNDGTTEGDDAEMFPRSVVEKLRQENGKHRQRAALADTYAARLHTELVRATGRLADPTDLPFDASHLDDTEALTAAIDSLLDAKPHLATRRPTGDIGQGQRGVVSSSFSLLDTLKSLT